MHKEIIEKLKNLSDIKFAEWLKPFINLKDTDEEIVLGIRVPILRKLAKEYKNLTFSTIQNLLESGIHEAKTLAVFILLLKSKQAPKEVCDFYLTNLEYINNWDLIDYTAPHIVAPNIKKNKLKELANSDYLWANRVAMVSCIYYIKQGDYTLTLELAKKFMKHPHHLMHKAAGWMLREIGKRDKTVLIDFLEQNSANMPSVMKSYAKECLR